MGLGIEAEKPRAQEAIWTPLTLSLWLSLVEECLKSLEQSKQLGCI